MRLSISIVNWNTTELLRKCLRSLPLMAPDMMSGAISGAMSGAIGGRNTEVIVVDNASSDFDPAVIRAEFPDVLIIANETNTGYARGNNQAMAMAEGDYILLLNPDTEVKPGALETLVSFMESHPEAAASGCRLVRPDGSIDQCVRGFPTPPALFAEYFGLAKLFPRSRRFGAYRMTWFGYDEVAEVDQVMGSCMIMSRKALDAIGPFDEEFPIFFNEVDWCLRAKQAGWKVYFTPDAEVLHLGGQSTKQVKSAMRLESQRSLERFYRKHYMGRIPAPVYWLVMAGIRLNTRLIRRQGKELRD